MRSQCMILFEAPFWVGIFETWDEEVYTVCRFVFGKEPTNSEIYKWLLAHYSKLSFKQTTLEQAPVVKKINPKKMKREIMKQVGEKYQGTKAQQTLKDLYAAEKEVHKKLSKEERDRILEQKYAQKQAKKKQKKRGH